MSEIQISSTILSLHKESDPHPNKIWRKGGGRGSVGPVQNATQLRCVFQEIEPPKFKSISRKAPHSADKVLFATFEKRYACLVLKIFGKKRSITGCDSTHSSS